MAQGDIVFFNQFYEDEGLKVHNLNTDTLKVGLVDNTTTPSASTANPHWSATGTNFLANEVTPGGNYTTGGSDTNNTFSESGGTATLGATDITWSQNGSNPTGVWWGIIYNDTATNKPCIAYIELGGPVDMTTGDLTINWGSSAIGTKAAA